MLAFNLSEADGEMLLIGLLAFIGALIFYKLDKFMTVQMETNALLKKVLGEKTGNVEDKAEKEES